MVEQPKTTVTPVESAVIPLAVYSDPQPGRPGNAVICAVCPSKSWYPATKHGSTLLTEAIAEHIAHTRQEKADV